MQEPKNWGTDVIPEEKWIDPAKTYRTRDGKRVVSLTIVLNNSTGAEVTFPVKGSVVLKEKPFRTTYCIWTIDGRNSVLDNETKYDLIEVKNG